LSSRIIRTNNYCRTQYLLVIKTCLCVISGVRREVVEKCALLGYYAASIGNFLATFRDNLSGTFLGFKNPKEMAATHA